MTARIQHNSLTATVLENVRRQIISLELPPGSKINLDRLAENLGVSVTPLREALNRLATQKLIRIETYRGFTVEPLLDLEQLNELVEVRHLIESHAIEKAVPTMDAKAIQELKECSRSMEDMLLSKAFDGLAFNEADRQFHGRIIEASGNSLLVDTYNGLNVHAQIARLFQQRGMTHGRLATEEHRQMLEAIEERDVRKAKKALKVHIENGHRRLVNLLRNLKSTQ